jgi:hypothetical protein
MSIKHIPAAILTLLLCALPALAGESNEHWHCGPYDIKIKIVLWDSYVPGDHITLGADDLELVVRKNGRDAGHGMIRGGVREIEKNGCHYHSCRTAWWSGVTRGGKYNGDGELLTIDGVTHYTEHLMSGKNDERLLKTEKHLCKRVR